MAGERVDFLERQAANYETGSTNYRSIELEVRKMEIIKMAAYEARTNSKD